MRRPPVTIRHLPARRAFTLAEALGCIVLVSGVMVAAVRAAAAGRRAAGQAAESAQGQLLAQAMLAEVTAEAFSEPSGGGTTLGIDSGETAADKTTFDDVDDYNGWSESPPQTPAGAAMTDRTGWRRTVAVAWATASDPGTASGSATSAKLVTVTVYRNSRRVATLSGVRTNAP